MARAGNDGAKGGIVEPRNKRRRDQQADEGQRGAEMGVNHSERVVAERKGQ